VNKVNYPPELKLWNSVLTLTVQDYVQGRMAGWESTEYLSAKEWIYADDQTPKNSFENVCMLCGLDAISVRHALENDTLQIYNRMNNKNRQKEEPCTETTSSTETFD
jgi:hypothetical protein